MKHLGLVLMLLFFVAVIAGQSFHAQGHESASRIILWAVGFPCLILGGSFYAMGNRTARRDPIEQGSEQDRRASFNRTRRSIGTPLSLALVTLLFFMCVTAFWSVALAMVIERTGYTVRALMVSASWSVLIVALALLVPGVLSWALFRGYAFARLLALGVFGAATVCMAFTTASGTPFYTGSAIVVHRLFFCCPLILSMLYLLSAGFGKPPTPPPDETTPAR